MPKVKVGTFTAIGGHGQTNWLQIGKTEMDWIKSISDRSLDHHIPKPGNGLTC
jgi:hypothetical protein